MNKKEGMSRTKRLILIGLFAALTAVGAFIRIPIPIVPFTLQLLFTMLAGLMLGGRDGAISVLCYIFIGLAGLPVFAGGGGIGYVLQPTFGYLIGFCVGALVTGRIANKVTEPSLKRLLAANFAGLLIVYGFGMIYYWMISAIYIGSAIGFWTLLLYCFILAVPGDILLCILAALLGKRAIPVIRREGIIVNG